MLSKVFFKLFWDGIGFLGVFLLFIVDLSFGRWLVRSIALGVLGDRRAIEGG